MFSHLSSLYRNELERQFLELLQFNINVPSSVYAKYYFDLRSLAEANNLSFPLEPLSRDRAYKLEVRQFVFVLPRTEYIRSFGIFGVFLPSQPISYQIFPHHVRMCPISIILFFFFFKPCASGIHGYGNTFLAQLTSCLVLLSISFHSNCLH